MRNLLFILLLISSNIYAEDISLNELRTLYNKSASDKTTCNKMVTDLKSYNETNNPTIAGYKACATMMMSKYAFNPINKLSNFKEGKNLLEKCIESDKTNIELRFLRFSVQCNAPGFLNYNSAIETDKTFLLKSLSLLKDIQLKRIIVSYLINSEYLTAIEKQNLKS